jgi:hypothetical protein
MITPDTTFIGPGLNGICLCGVDAPKGWAELDTGISIGYSNSVTEITVAGQNLKWITSGGLCGTTPYLIPAGSDLSNVRIKIGEMWRDGLWSSSVQIVLKAASVNFTRYWIGAGLTRRSWIPGSYFSYTLVPSVTSYQPAGLTPNWASCGYANNCCNSGLTVRTITYYDDGSATFT